MKRYGYILQGAVFLLAFACCTATDDLCPGEQPGQDEPVPVILRAASHTRAAVNEGEAFNPLLVCSDKPDFGGSLRWQENATVGTDGVVTYAAQAPVYPSLGAYIYVAGLHPQGATLSGNGTAVYTLDGTGDLMYAPPLQGSRWDGMRIGGNTDVTKDRPLAFEHMLSQVQLAAIRTAEDLAGQNDFRITKITWKKITVTATVQLAKVAEGGQQVSFAGASMLPAMLYKDENDDTKTVLITSRSVDAPDAVGYALLPPSESYLADVETSVGTFTDLTVAPEKGGFESGYAHRIILVLNDKGLSIRAVTLNDWEDVDGGSTGVN